MFDPFQRCENQLLGTRTFARSNDFDQSEFYGKPEYAEKVIAKNFAQVNFDGFKPLLDRLVNAINHNVKIVSHI